MKTAMQELKEDLFDTLTTSKEALKEIEDKEKSKDIYKYLEATLRLIIKEIENYYILKEQEQIINAYTNKCDFYSCEDKKEKCVCGLKYYERNYIELVIKNHSK
jgi:hypothetical protein